MKYLFTLLLLTLLSSNSLSQFDFIPGIIITKSQDTLSGLIENSYLKKTGKQCSFKEQSGSPAQKFKPSDLLGFKYDEGRFFVSKAIPSGEGTQLVFLEFMVDGEADLFLRRSDEGFEFFLENKAGELMELKNTEKTDGYDQFQLYSKREYIGALKVLLKDCPEIYPEIDKLKFRKKDLLKITKNYHNRVCTEYECIDYEKNYKNELYLGYSIGMVSSHVVFEPKSSPFDFMEDESFTGKISPTFGLQLQITKLLNLPEKIIFSTQVAYHNHTYKSENVELNFKTLSIPLWLQFNFNSEVVRPFFKLGINNSFYLKKEVLSVNDFVNTILTATLGTYQLHSLAGLGVEVEHNQLKYFISSNFQVGLGLNTYKDAFNNDLASTTYNWEINVGMRKRIK